MSTIITFSIDHSKIDGTLTDFPVMIKLDDLDDVQKVWSNFEIPEEVMKDL